MANNTMNQQPLSVTEQLRSINLQSFSSEIDRKSMIIEARSLLARIETPYETVLRLSWFQSSLVAMIRTAIHLKLFESWARQGAQPLDFNGLQNLVEADPVLLGRILRHLVTGGVLNLSTEGKYSSTPFSVQLADEHLARNIDETYALHTPVYLNLPNYLASLNYQNPTDPVNTNWSSVKGMPIMESIRSDPKIAACVASSMRLSSPSRGSICDVYPTQSLFSGTDTDSKILVDIGGNVGHDSTAFLNKHPEAAGRIVLQDLPEVLQGATDLDPGIERMPHDFNTLQPVKGAAAYYFHSVFHDWPDPQVKIILESLKPAMKKGYSKLLVQDIVVDTAHPRAQETHADITMMSVASASERTTSAWKELLESNGFIIRNIHRNPLYSGSVIEAELR